MFLCAGSPAGATTIVWADTGSDFATSTDWTGNVAPKNDITSDIASFGTVANFQPVLAANRSVSGLAFTSTSGVTLSGAGVLTLGAKGINNSSTSGLKTVDNNLTLGAAQSFTNNGSLTIAGPVNNGGFLLTLTGTGAAGTLSGDVSGTGGLTKAGTGIWVLSGNNTYTGPTAITAGALSINSLADVSTASAFGAPTTTANGTIKIGATTTAATLIYTGGATSSNRVIDLAGTTGGATIQADGTGALTLTSDLTASGAGKKTLTLTGSDTDDNTISGAIVNNSATNLTSLVKAGTGTWLLSGNNTYTGTTTVNNGTLKFGSDSSLANSAVTVNANLAGATALLDLHGSNATVTSLTFGGAGGTSTSLSNVSTGSGTLTLGGNVTFTSTGSPLGSTLSGNLDLGSANRTFTIGDSTSAPYDLTVSANISSSSGAYGFTKAGTGTLLLDGNNSYSGTTTLSAGTLRATNAQAFGSGSLSLAAGTLSLAGDTGLAFGNDTAITNTVTIESDVLTAGGAGVTHTLGALTQGSKTLTISQGANVGSGTSGITFGATTLTGNAAFNTGSGTLLTLGALNGNGAARTVTKSGAGTLLLDAAASSWTNASALAVNNGTVQLGAGSALGSGATLTNVTVNATTAGTTALLDLNGFDQSILALTFGGTGGTSTSTSNVSTGSGTLTLGGNVTLTSTGNPLGSTLSGNLDLGGATRTFTIGDSSGALYDLTVSANISSNSGAYGLTKSGAGTLLLNGNNSYTGATTVSAGTLNIESNSALGGTGGATSVASGAALELQNGITVTGESLTLTGTGVGSNGALRNVADNNTWTGGVTLSGNTNIQSDAGQLSVSGNITGTNRTLTVDGAGDTVLSGAVSLGSGALIKNDGGNLTLSGTSANTYTGATTINDGTVNLNKTAGVNALGTGAITVGDGTGAASSANLVLLASNQIANTAALTLNADGNLALNNFADSIDTVAGTGQIDLGSSGYLTVGASNGSSTFGGSVTGGGTLEKAGTGTLTFNSSVVFTGTLTLSGGTIDLNGYNLTVGTLHITGNSILDFGNSAASILTATTLIIDTGVTLTINNWVDAVDYFYATNDPGGSQGNPPLNQITFTGGSYTNNDTQWLSYDHQITPAPEPAVTGAVLAGCAALLLVWRRRRLVPA